MDWDNLRIFLAVSRQGQLLGAARRLGLNHATVARRLKALEDALGAPLFERRPTGCIPTQAGERLLPVAERIEFELTSVGDAVSKDEADISGTVRVGAPDGLGNLFLAQELAQFARLFPNLVVELVPLPRTFSLSRREADIAISLDHPTGGRLLVSRLCDYSLSVFASEAYLKQFGEPTNLDELDRHTVVTGVEDFAYASALDYSDTLERKAGARFRCAGVVGQIEAVRAGTGVGILHDFAVTERDRLVRILPDITFRRSYFMLLHPDSVAIRRIAAVRDFLTRRFREERARFTPARDNHESVGVRP